MPVIIGVLIGLALLATLIGLGAGWATLHDHERRITGLEGENKEQARGNRHDRLGRAQTDIGEAFLFALISMSEDAKVLQTKIDYYTGLAEHIRNGGKPDDRTK